MVAFSVLLPLYIYPTTSSWQPLLSAISAYPTVNFQVVISPNVGPGSGIPDANYITNIAQLNSYSNVQTFGYVYSGYGNRLLSSMEADVNVYQTWNQYTDKDIHVDGVFIDGTPSNTQYIAALQGLANYAKNTLTSGGLVFLNPGRPVDPSFYTFADWVNAFEDRSEYANGTAAGMPAIVSSVVPKSSFILHDYTDGTPQLKIDTCNYIAQGFAGGLITTSDGNFNDFSNYWSQYVADIAACLGGSSTAAASVPSSSSSSVITSAPVATSSSAARATSSAVNSAAYLASLSSASMASASSVSAASASSVSAASASSVSAASASSASRASASSASLASVSSASAASASSAAAASSASSASLASAAAASSASSASLASASSASVASASRVQASKTSGCTTVSNTAAATNQLLVNPSFEWVDSSCTETIYPWVSNNMVTYNNWQTQDGKWYVSGYQNNAYVSQNINSTNYGTYQLSAWYRLPTAYSGGNYNDYCTVAITLDSKTLYSGRIPYGTSIVGNTPENQLTVSNIAYTSTSAGVFTVGWTCTNSVKISIDLDYITLTKTA